VRVSPDPLVQGVAVAAVAAASVGYVAIERAREAELSARREEEVSLKRNSFTRRIQNWTKMGVSDELRVNL